LGWVECLYLGNATLETKNVLTLLLDRVLRSLRSRRCRRTSPFCFPLYLIKGIIIEMGGTGVPDLHEKLAAEA
jgi:hypothetical protein